MGLLLFVVDEGVMTACQLVQVGQVGQVEQLDWMRGLRFGVNAFAETVPLVQRRWYSAAGIALLAQHC
jgi:hypothetical protein